MRKICRLSILLTALVISSLALTYVLLFSHRSLTDFLVSQREVTTEVSDTAGDDYHQFRKRQAYEFFGPLQGTLQNNKKSYLLNNYAMIHEVGDLIREEGLHISDFKTMKKEEALDYNSEYTHLELSFNTYIPLLLFEDYLTLPEEFSTDFSFNKMLLVTSGQREIFLVNGASNQYVKIDTPSESFFNDVVSVLNDYQKEWVEAKRYEFADGAVHLPIKGVTVSSEVYVVEKISDSLVLDRVFDSTYNADDGINADVRNYQDINNILRLDGRHHSMSLQTSVVNREGKSGPKERFKRESDLFEKFDYWPEEIRYNLQDDSRTTFRRYLNGFPILSPSDSHIDYGAMKLESYKQDDTRVTNIVAPTNTFQIHIDTLSEPVRLMNAEEIMDVLAESDVDLDMVNGIFVAYQWLGDDIDMKKVELVPKWHATIKGKVYALDQLTKEE